MRLLDPVRNACRIAAQQRNDIAARRACELRVDEAAEDMQRLAVAHAHVGQQRMARQQAGGCLHVPGQLARAAGQRQVGILCDGLQHCQGIGRSRRLALQFVADPLQGVVDHDVALLIFEHCRFAVVDPAAGNPFAESLVRHPLLHARERGGNDAGSRLQQIARIGRR
ncbi:hypothetical protein V4C85_18430 [Ralstonia solanacearum]|uniref:hypothetical protein n=1 Tax=Ralstonia solanacearum TaxID=305 RepID=UPI001E3C5D14|nr:hypothetical protein [Ralstonia solanacearum]